jgi:hypothetical protein
VVGSGFQYRCDLLAKFVHQLIGQGWMVAPLRWEQDSGRGRSRKRIEGGLRTHNET